MFSSDRGGGGSPHHPNSSNGFLASKYDLPMLVYGLYWLTIEEKMLDYFPLSIPIEEGFIKKPRQTVVLAF